MPSTGQKKQFWRFLWESEKTRALSQGIDSGSPRVPNQNEQQNRAFYTKIGGKDNQPNFFSEKNKKEVQKC
jgi:hypothetical protein